MANQKKLYIIYTGGTIGMKKTAQGYEPAPHLLQKLMNNMPEFTHSDMPNFTINEYDNLIDSANMQYADWQTIAEDLINHYDQYDGFIVLHGTDTMAYTASALSFMLAGFNKPVILTGSQIPLIEVQTDARENLIMAMLIAAKYHIPEVCVYFNNLLLRGNRTQKVNAYSFGAFASPNFPALGKVGINIDIRNDLLLKNSNANLTISSINRDNPPRIHQLTFSPGFDISQLKAIINTKPQALILHTYGLGNAPVKDINLLRVLEKIKEQGTLIINHTQCRQGGVVMGSYATSKALENCGVVSAFDMTLEAIVGKLSVLLSQSLKQNEVAHLFAQDLRGELTVIKL